MKKTKIEFILDTLLPFKEDPSTCGFEDQRCVYLANNGNKCALGKHMKEGKWQSENDFGFLGLTYNYAKEDFLTDEALEQNLSMREWVSIQCYHDALARDKSIDIRLTKLEDETGIEFPELKQ